MHGGVWGEVLDFFVTGQTRAIEIAIVDDMAHGPSSLGRASVNLAELGLSEERVEAWVPLKGMGMGKVLVVFEYLGPAVAIPGVASV